MLRQQNKTALIRLLQRCIRTSKNIEQKDEACIAIIMLRQQNKTALTRLLGCLIYRDLP